MSFEGRSLPADVWFVHHHNVMATVARVAGDACASKGVLWFFPLLS